LIKAAGVLFLVDNEVLLLQRSGEGDAEGEWALPGGKIEDGEDEWEAACRECVEEIGYHPDAGKLFTRRQRNGVDYTTFLTETDQKFTPKLNDEHTDYAWAPVEGPWPEPLHPGVLVTLKRLRMNETEVAEAIRDGDLTSPQFFENIAFFAMRITGTGLSFREASDEEKEQGQTGEHVYRDPAIYLNERFLKRCNGLPIILEHPPGNLLTSKEYSERTIGVAILPWIKGDEIWCIARLYDAFSVKLLREHKLSTSPSVYFKDPRSVNRKIELSKGETLLIEGNPDLLDHLAVCPMGVWDKGGPPTGVDSQTTGDTGKMADPMVDTQNENAMSDKAKKDAAEGDPMSRILELLDGFDSRLAKLEGGGAEGDKAKKDAEVESAAEREKMERKEGEGDKAKKDSGDGDREQEKLEDRSEKKPPMDEKKDGESDLKADKAKKDSWDDKDKEKDDKVKKDSWDDEKAKGDSARFTQAQVEEIVRRRFREEERARASGDQSRTAAINAERAKIEDVAAAFGDRAPTPFFEESLFDYRKRAYKPYQKHSQAMAPIDLSRVTDENALDHICGVIRADALKAAFSPSGVPEGSLREIKRTDGTGRVISEFVGKPSAWLNDFKGPVQYLRSINKGTFH
jgi:8-oxo-dGTP pyrophosphatase MutT (NUDIX family)